MVLEYSQLLKTLRTFYFVSLEALKMYCAIRANPIIASTDAMIARLSTLRTGLIAGTNKCDFRDHKSNRIT